MSTFSSSNIDRPLRIGEAARVTGLSVDTLRYYEKLGLLRPGRTHSGVRFYGERELSVLRFIRRAKAMNFSLEEIARLLEMRANPRHARDEVRELTHHKLKAISAQIEELGLLKNELTLLLNLCRGAEDGCPIIESLEAVATGSESNQDDVE